MPLHGKIVVIKRSGGDGTEFPLTASCLFGRKPDCDIRIQLPQVSKEHCRIDFNENKEVILTNLSSVNPTCVNGEVLQQSERLKHGDVITIIDRSFRFEYPPAPTPKKKSSTGGKVLQDQQVVDTVTVETNEKRISEVSTDPHLKDGTNHDNIQRSLEKTMEMESKEGGSLQQKTTSPFSDLYQMIKNSLDVRTPRKSSASLLQTPTSRFCTPKPGSVRKNVGKPVISTEDTPKEDEVKVFPGAGTQMSINKQRKTSLVPTTEMTAPVAEEAKDVAMAEATSPQKRNRVTPQRFTACEVIDQISAQKPQSPMRRRSKEATPLRPAVTASKTEHLQKASPKNSGKVEKVKETSKKRKSGELPVDLPAPEMKKKRVSFGGHLSPELFDKRLPPNSPLRKGAAPRRSLCLSKPKQSLLRRKSVIGYRKEFEHDGTPSPKKSSVAKNSPKSTTPGKKSPKSRTPSPKAASPGKKSPKSRTPSPKAASPGKKSPKSRTPSPKAASPGKKSPKSRTPSPKAASPGKKSPKSRTPSPKAASPGKKSPKSKAPNVTPTGKRRLSMVVSTPAPQENPPNTDVTPAKTVQTPKVQGRFSVSRIHTPSPVADDALCDQMPSITVTPKIPLRRKSMKSTSRKTSSAAKGALKVIRRSGVSRASIKAINSWADIVKFGQTKTQMAAPAKSLKVTKRATKKAVSKPQTPASKLKGHFSTGHADSPVTLVVGRAYKQKLVHPTGAAPRVVTNISLRKKDMKMDEDLTGISEIFKTPVNDRKRKSETNVNSPTKTPVGNLGMSLVEPSVLTTPEEPGEMIVSPLSVASTVKDRRYNNEAVQRLLNVDQETSFVSDVTALEIPSDPSEQQSIELKTTTVTTPKLKPELPLCLTGVKRIMTTPKQKVKPVEDLRGKLLKTPKQKSQQQECLTGVKRIMKTPKVKGEPVEDIRGKLLVTPKQKPQQQECLTGVKRIMKTPREKAEPIEDLRGKLLVTPKQKPQLQECLTGVKRIMTTPKQEAERLEEVVLMTPKCLEADNMNLDGGEDVLKTPAGMQESTDLSEMTDMKTPNTRSSAVLCLTDIQKIMKTPREKSAPVEDMVGVKRLMRTPREKGKPVEDNFGIKRLMKSPRLRGSAPVEDFEGLQELMEEPHSDPTGHTGTNEVEYRSQPDCGSSVPEETMDTNDVFNNKETPNGPDDIESSDALETVSQAVDGDLPIEEHKVEADENLSEDPEVETAAATEPDYEKKSVRGRRAKTAQSKAAEDKQEATKHPEDIVIPAPVKGRRGKKTETTAPPTVKQTSRNRRGVGELTVEESAPQPSKVALKPTRGRPARKVYGNQAENQKVTAKVEAMPETESEQRPPVTVSHEENNHPAPLEKVVSKPRRGRKTKQEPDQSPDQQDVPQPDAADAHKVCSGQLDVEKNGNEENNSTDAMETVLQAPVTECLPDKDTAVCTETDVAVVQKRSVRGRRPKVVSFKTAENEQDATEHPEDPAVPAPARGRRGRKTETTAPSVARQTTRGRNAKSQESTSHLPEPVQDKAVKTLVAVSDQPSAENNSQEENKSAPPVEEAVVKPKGRKTRVHVVPPQPEPEKKEDVSDQHLVADGQPQQPNVGKPRRGRKTKPDTVERHEVSEDAVVTVEMKQQTPSGIRATRGRNAKREEEKLENDSKAITIEAHKSHEPVKKLRRTRNAEHDNVEPREEETQTAEAVLPEEAEVVVAPMKTKEQSAVTAKPRRGGRKIKESTESKVSVESTEIQEVPDVISTDKPKRGRRGKRVTEEVGVPEEKAELLLETEHKKNSDPDASVIKSSSTSGMETEVSQTIPAKRARRGAALPLEDSNAEATVLVPESALTSVEPARRGRRAAAKTVTHNAAVSSDVAKVSEELNSAVVEENKTSKKSVRWKPDLEVFKVSQVTPVKAGRGRKSKLGDHVEAESNHMLKDANKTEEKDLSDNVVETQPIKRARRGAKVTDEDDSSGKVEKRGAEAETQPKTRRGRSAKK